MPKEIMRLIPVGKDYLWGGTRLKEEYGKNINMIPLAETWECSVHPDGISIVANGNFRGQLLINVLNEHPDYMGTKVKDGSFPILVKFIDAKEKLSVQVHPDDDYAKKYEKQNGKSELWYILDAKKGATIVYGFRHRMNKELLEQAIESKTLNKYLNFIEVHSGDVFYVPAGTVHGIGAGILLAEIQESSNVTYRLYDYDRLDKNGEKRDLHFDQAVRVMNMEPVSSIKQKPRIIHYSSGTSREDLCRCRYFDVEKIRTTMGFTFSVMDDSFQILMCIEGEGGIETMNSDGKSIRFKKGETMFLPAGLGKCVLFGRTTLLKIRC